MYHQLLYISTASHHMSPSDVESILSTARRLNETNAIRGLLISSSRHFMQVLEGEEAMVRQTYDRICADPRHHAHVILRKTEVEQPQFGEWSMASEILADGSFDDMCDQVRAAASGCDVITRGYLMGFAARRGAAA